MRTVVHGMARTRRAAMGMAAALVLSSVLEGCRREPPLPVLGKVPHFTLVDESGRPFTEDKLRGKVWAATFFSSRCATDCPTTTRLLHEVQIIARTRGVPLDLVSFSVDPEHDTPDVLRRYAEDHGADPKTWTFVTGNAESIRDAVVRGFEAAMQGHAGVDAADSGIAHGSRVVLVDRQLQIRGRYATTGKDEMGQLLGDAGRLATR